MLHLLFVPAGLFDLNRRLINPKFLFEERAEGGRESSLGPSRNRRCRSRRPVFAVSSLDLRANLLERFALIHHLHHVTRDSNADASAQAHPIEL
jgi:hypothetical protein